MLRKTRFFVLFLALALMLAGCAARAEIALPDSVPALAADEPTCTISISCQTLLGQLDNLNPDKRELVPADGILLAPTTVSIESGESVFDVLLRVTRDNKIQMEFSRTPGTNAAYIEGIGNLYEFDCGSLSGWMFRVSGEFPNYSCSDVTVADGDTIEWVYTCDLGADVGDTVE